MSKYENTRYERTAMLMSDAAVDLFRAKRVAVFGIGGVGSYVVEALVRSGIGTIDIIDSDEVCLSNINRQLIATNATLGMKKVDAMEQRIHDIDPAVIVNKHCIFYLPETKGECDFSEYDYVVDAVDTVTAKLIIIEEAKRLNIPVISCMGAGNKLDPTGFEVADIYKTSVCPLAKVMRRELRNRSIESLKVVYSKEEPVVPCNAENGGRIPASVAFVPSVAGLIIAGEVLKDIVKDK